MTQSTDAYVSWTQYHHLIESLAAQIYESGWRFNQIICLARGGLRVGDLLSRMYNQPLAILSASSYGGESFQARGHLRFAENLTMSEPELGDRILLVDDLVDSGITLSESIRWLHQSHHISPQNCRTAVLWYKASSSIVPDYFVQYCPDNPWIHQPFEPYENQSLSTLIETFRRTGQMLEEPILQKP